MVVEQIMRVCVRVDRSRGLRPQRMRNGGIVRPSSLSTRPQENGLDEPEGGLSAHSAAAQEAASRLFSRLPGHSVVVFKVDTCQVRARSSWFTLIYLEECAGRRLPLFFFSPSTAMRPSF